MKTLTDLGWNECKFIEGEPDADALFCAEPAIAGRPYCARHHARAYKAPMIPRSLAAKIRHTADAETPKAPRVEPDIASEVVF
jgi:hypothetical protein